MSISSFRVVLLRIYWVIRYAPALHFFEPKDVGQLVDEVKQMGFNLQKSTSVMAINPLCAATRSTWSRSCEVYKRWGWSEDDVLSAFKRYPHFTMVSEKKLILTMVFLVKKMGWPSVMIAKSPVVTCYSLEKRFIPRCSLVKVLLLKGLINGIENVSLCSVLVPPEKCFLERFVARYIDEVAQLLSVYHGRVEVQDV